MKTRQEIIDRLRTKSQEDIEGQFNTLLDHVAITLHTMHKLLRDRVDPEQLAVAEAVLNYLGERLTAGKLLLDELGIDGCVDALEDKQKNAN